MTPLTEVSCTAVETSHGMLFFVCDNYGVKLQNQYLQSMANHYFDPDFDFGPVRLYDCPGVPAGAEKHVNLPFLSLGAYEYFPTGNLSEEDRKNMKLYLDNSMEPTPAAFNRFIDAVKMQVTHKNMNICTALTTLEEYEKVVEKLSHEVPTEEIRQRIFEAQEDYDLQDQLLYKSYDVRGHRSVRLILNNPEWIVRVDDVELTAHQRDILKLGHCLYLPENEKKRPDHRYAWVGPEFKAILFSDNPPRDKKIFKVKTTFSPARNPTEKQQTPKKAKAPKVK